MSCVFGFDVGSRITGVAIGNTYTASARALATLAVRDDNPDWPRLDTLRQQWQPDTLVVGLPLTLDGAEQPASRRARQFAVQLQQRYGLPVVLVDERHSSQEAAQRFAAARAVGLKRRRDATDIDAEAAAVILERWLAGADTPAADTPGR
ncbi:MULTISPECIES: Holliday junction resolvase RuvX [Rhodanobacter]|uniref:Putative pre-16S rRNA nuclease n=1 Tax=Rhodanobacter denitrificans TaxID=666685 RepID=M4NBN8_9GAMM|nr:MULTISPECIES: Holliday junction resolvase RuvX [Rhodanobacter]AGG88019.1 RNAse H-fold protein YqgF [Rhodanobacter denitrificans]KZC20529.1 crossover junction endodeoxyribonuclease RuvA [Rhodanobacter denitrificans]UJJ51917.1 Holliday junction resolvase RuvX [Rhodanobacter denitrificans]UJJ59305.1 Holliday junction resolvase RuvX [Rhodanobacter denitrificans]UJM87173.1 Holliday junction resolvase RuvX [Rhodanobacter denitrificans]